MCDSSYRHHLEFSSRGKLEGKGGKFAQATFFNRIQPFFDYMSINLPSSAAEN